MFGILNDYCILQKTYKQLAEEKGLHLVEFRRENDFFPSVVASPTKVRTDEEIDPDEPRDLTTHVFDGKLVLQREKHPRFYKKLFSYNKFRKGEERRRDQDKVRLRMYMEHGELRSFLTDQYPDEAVCKFWSKKRREAEKMGE